MSTIRALLELPPDPDAIAHPSLLKYSRDSSQLSLVEYMHIYQSRLSFLHAKWVLAISRHSQVLNSWTQHTKQMMRMNAVVLSLLQMNHSIADVLGKTACRL